MGKFPYFSDIHEEIREIARGAAEEFKKTAEEADRNHDYKIIEKNMKRLGELNLFGIHVPTEYGGEGLDLVGHFVALEEVAKGCLSTAFSSTRSGWRWTLSGLVEPRNRRRST